MLVKDFFRLSESEGNMNQYQYYGHELFNYIHENQIQLDIKWEKGGSDVLESKLLKGPVLCRMISENIKKSRPDFYVAKQEIVKVIIRVKGNDNRYYYLMTIKEQSRRLQFPGGKLEPNETPEEALEREIAEEIPECGFRLGENCHCTPARNTPTESILISPTYGVPIKFIIHYFILTMNEEEKIKTTASQWVSQDELLSGATNNGILLMPPPEEFKNLLICISNKFSTNVRHDVIPSTVNSGNQNSRSLSKKEHNPMMIVVAFSLLILATTASGILASVFASNHFGYILGSITVLVVLGSVFVLRMSNKISEKNTKSLFENVLKLNRTR